MPQPSSQDDAYYPQSLRLVQNGQLLFHFVELGSGKNRLCTLAGARNTSIALLSDVTTSTLVQVIISS